MKSVKALSERQIVLLLEVWVTAHNAIDRARQPFTYKVGDSDRSEWDDLISNGYIAPILDNSDRFILTDNTDGIFDELVAAITD